MTVRDERVVRIQEKGQVTLPVAVRRRLGLRKGDLIAVRETSEGILLSRLPEVPAEIRDRMGKTLEEQGVSLSELFEWGERGQTPLGIPLREYTREEIEQFLADDVLTEEQLAAARRVDPGWPAP